VRLLANALTRPRPSPFGASIEVEVARGRLEGARLLARIPQWDPAPRVETGEELRLRGRLRALDVEWGDRGAGGRFDFGAHLRRRGFAGELLLEQARPTGRRRGGLAGLLDGLRRRAERAVAAGLPPPEAALVRGMVLGQDEAIDRATREDFRDSGLAHLLAVSGQNVMLLVALALPPLAVAGLGPRARGVALLGLVALYVPLAGAGPSLQRAGVMAAAGIAALTLSRPASRWYALLLAAAATLLLNPRAWADAGWQLSFAAVTGILLLGLPLGRTLAAAGESLTGRGGPVARAALRGVSEGAAITIAASLATAPLLAHHFDSVPVAGLPANLLALPAVAPAMWLGMLKAGLGIASPLLPGSVAVAELAGPAARVPVAYLAQLAERFADLPGGQLGVPVRGSAAIAFAYAALLLAAAGVRALARRGSGRAQEVAAAWRRRAGPARTMLVAATSAALLVLLIRALSPPPAPDALTVRFLDVGQGDATLVQHPDGTAILFDGGPPEAGIAPLLRRAGVRRLALVVATHASRDHHGGLPAVLADRPVDLMLDGGDGSRDPAFRALLRSARQRGVPTRPATAPLVLRVGSLRVRILSPPPRPPGPPPEDPNPRAVVAIVSAGEFDLMLSADAESEALLPLELPDVDAMKVPHHGSADPGLPAVLKRLRPELAAIEVGENSYGHPTAQALGALRRANVPTYRTDREGTVVLTVERGGMEVDTER
jgi:competence protein ComEC